MSSEKSFVTRGRILRGPASAETVKGARPARASAESAADRHDEAQAKLAAIYLAMKAREERVLEANLDHTTELAVALAERLLGAALEIEPSKIVEMARLALLEAKGARKARIEANPIDVDALREHADLLGESIRIEPNADLARGSLVLHTDLGTLDARLTPQLERLARSLRDALR